MATTDPIGSVEEVEGEVFLIRVDGERVTAEPGDSIFEGDIMETVGAGHATVVMIDGSTLSMAEDARISFDELSYDSEAEVGSSEVSVFSGVFALISGAIAALSPGASVVNTPAGTIGIRGTTSLFSVDADGILSITLMVDADGTVGELDITTDYGVEVLNQIGLLLTASPETQPIVVELEEAAMFLVFGDELGRILLDTARQVQDDFLGSFAPEAGGAGGPTGQVGGFGTDGSISIDNLDVDHLDVGSVEGYIRKPRLRGIADPAQRGVDRVGRRVPGRAGLLSVRVLSPAEVGLRPHSEVEQRPFEVGVSRQVRCADPSIRLASQMPLSECPGRIRRGCN